MWWKIPKGGTPIWYRRGCLSEILNSTPKGEQSGRGLSFLWPLQDTKNAKNIIFFLYFFAGNPQRDLYGLKYVSFAPDTLNKTKHPKFTPLSETTSIPVCLIWETPPGETSTVLKERNPTPFNRPSMLRYSINFGASPYNLGWAIMLEVWY